jgi:hypothetical protein
MKTERERAWWRRDTEAVIRWFEGLLLKMAREAPIDFAGMQFEAAIKLEQLKQERRRHEQRRSDSVQDAGAGSDACEGR